MDGGCVKPFVERYHDCFAQTWTDTTPIHSVRFVVLDSETTGLDPRKDRLITIGAVSVINGEVILEDSFEALLKVDYNTSAITVHGVTREESREGEITGRIEMLAKPASIYQPCEWIASHNQKSTIQAI